jgi:hypothetical protein
MPTQEELDAENQASLRRQRKTRSLRKEVRRLNQEKNNALQFARSTSQRRAIKEAYEGAVYDLSTDYMPSQNKDDYESDIGQRGIDQFTPPEATPQSGLSGGGGIPEGFTEETLDVVENDNSAGQRIFLTQTP